MSPLLLSPNEVAAFAKAPKSVVEKALEQNVFRASRGGRGKPRSLPLHAVAVAAAVKSLGRRLTASDKRRVADALASMSRAALGTAEVEVAPSMVLRVGALAREAVERAERYAVDRDAYIEAIKGVQGGRPVIKGTRLTVSAIRGRIGSGEPIEALMEDYPGIPRRAFEAAIIYAATHPQVGRPATRSRPIRA